MNRPVGWSLLVLAAAAVAIGFRLPRLKQRPMHCDEAVHAIKFGELLEDGSYGYDPSEYHGPTLNYLTLIPAWISRADTITAVNESTLRIVPVFFGVGLVLVVFLLADGLGRQPSAIAAVLTAVSPAFVFYSRYYIQEMLLVCLTFAAVVFGYTWLRTKKMGWALAAGVSLGLAHATKETFIVFLASALAALLLTIMLQCRRKGGSVSVSVSANQLLALVFAAVAVSLLFYSSFFTNPSGVFDAFRTYATYFTRASGASVHIHPWYYYLKMLIWSRYGDGPAWSEAFIVGLAVVGFVVAFTKQARASFDSSLLRFIAIYTLIMTAGYSAIPYKTPWCLLSFFQGMVILAGAGAKFLTKSARGRLPRVFVVLLLTGGFGHLVWQSYLANYRYYADPRSPYVYAHPTEDVLAIDRRMKELALASPAGFALPIQVICPDDDYWPLPWYFSSFSQVGWYSRIPDDFVGAGVIIISADLEPDLAEKVFQRRQPDLYVSLFDRPLQLRPGIELRSFVTMQLWDLYQRLKVNQSSAE